MKIKIDNKEIIVKDNKKNIVEIAQENGISILAPCFRNKKKHGCCNVCVVEADGEQKYACNLKPKDGMDITYDRLDLEDLRKERLKKYTEAIQSGDTSGNTCGGNSSCGDSSSQGLKTLNSSCCG